MLFKTYQKITTLFKEHHGYMSFADLRDHQVTVLQLAEMEEEQKFPMTKDGFHEMLRWLETKAPTGK